MVQFTKSTNSFLVEFTDNELYLDNGKVSMPTNSLTLTIDKSDIATFRKSSNNDVFFSGLIENCEFDGTQATKSTIGGLFQNTCTSAVGGSDPETTVTDVEISEDGTEMDFVNASGDTVYSVDMTQYLVDLHVTGASLSGESLTLYIAGGDPVVVDLSGMMDDYYTSSETDTLLAEKLDTSAFTSAEQAIANALADIYDDIVELSAHTATTLVAGDNITISGDVISSNQVIELTQAEYDELVEQGTVDESKIYIITDAPEINLNIYTLTSTTAALQTQVNANTAAIAGKQDTLTAGEGITIENGVISAEADLSDYYTKEEIDNAEQATSAALNDLNIRKLDASAYTPVDLTDYATKQELQEAIADIDLSEVEASIAAVSTQVDTNAEVTARALNELQSSKADKSSLADYATKAEVQEAISEIDLSEYATTADTASLQTAINNKADASALNGYATTATTDNIQSQLTALQTTVAGKAQIVHLTQAQYDALATKDANTIYIIDDAVAPDLSLYATKQYVDDLINGINSRLTAINA